MAVNNHQNRAEEAIQGGRSCQVHPQTGHHGLKLWRSCLACIHIPVMRQEVELWWKLNELFNNCSTLCCSYVISFDLADNSFIDSFSFVSFDNRQTGTFSGVQ